MYIITVNERPATFAELYRMEDKSYPPDVPELYMATRTRREALSLYLYHFGFTWGERPLGVEVRKFKQFREN